MASLFELFPDTTEAVRLLNENGFKVIVITNQSGVARGYFTEATLARIHEKMKEELNKGGAQIDSIYYCPHHPDDNCECRKPKPKLVLQAAKDFNVDLKHSFFIGDHQVDIELGKSVGCGTILVKRSSSVIGGIMPDIVVSNLLEAAHTIFEWH